MEKESRNKKIVRMSSRKQTTGKTNTKKKRHGAKSRNKCEKLKWNFHNALLFIVQIENKILTQFFFNYLKCGSVIVKGLQSCLNTLSFFFFSIFFPHSIQLSNILRFYFIPRPVAFCITIFVVFTLVYIRNAHTPMWSLAVSEN